jgi:3-hydroxyisobutyrate dehydrogenase
MSKRLAFIGLGNMGSGMASRLAQSGYDVAVYNRTRAKSEEVAKQGARVAESPADAASEAEVVLTSLADQDVVGAMLFGDDGVFGSLPQGGRIVDTSTVPPGFARELSERAAAAGYSSLDACVYGAPHHAGTGELRIMVGGDEADFREVEDILQTLGKDVAYLGASGMGATMKLVLNQLMGVQMPAMAEAIAFGESAGLPRERILQMIAGSGYSSPVMTFRCGMLEREAYGQAAFRLSLMRKDMKLLLAEGQELGVPLPVSESAYAMLTAAMQQGLGDLDVAAIVPFMERLAGLDDRPWPVEGGEPPQHLTGGGRV